MELHAVSRAFPYLIFIFIRGLILRLKSLKAEYCTLRHKEGLKKCLEKKPRKYSSLKDEFLGNIKPNSVLLFLTDSF